MERFSYDGVINPVIVAILMPLSSLTVIVSSSLARTFRSPEGSRHDRGADDEV